MLFSFRKYLSLFTLIIFLFPTVVEELHAFEHSNDFHCNETESKHFHPTEHHCNICDFVPLVTDKPILSYQISSKVVASNCEFILHHDNVVQTHNYNFSLRAPPVIS
jgi:hypothetical protein